MTAQSIRFLPFIDGQGGMIEIFDGEVVFGWLYYSLYGDGSAAVDAVEVIAEYHRQGLAKRMLQVLIDQHPEVVVYRAAVASDASQALFDSMAGARPDLTFDLH